MPGILVDLLDDALLVVELVDRVLELPVEHQPVGDDDDGIEDLLVAGVVQASQAVRQPGNFVALAAAGGVLDQVVVADTLLLRVGFQAADGDKLVIAWEDHGFFSDFLVADHFLFDLEVDESAQDVEKGITLPDFLPQIGGLIAVWVIGVAGPGVASLVERQEEGLGAFKPGRHPDDIGIDREMH